MLVFHLLTPKSSKNVPQEKDLNKRTHETPPRLFSLELNKNSGASKHIHTAGHVRHFCKFLHHIVQSRLSALQLVREIIQHTRRTSRHRRRLLSTVPDTVAKELNSWDLRLSLCNHQTDNIGIQSPQSFYPWDISVFDFGILEI